MKKFGKLISLMILTILVIVGFQAWWLIQNYQRERNVLKTNVSFLFRETVMNLQGEKLKIEGTIRRDSVVQHIKVGPALSPSDPPKQVVNMYNLIEQRARDSSKKKQVFITVDRTSVHSTSDSAGPVDLNWIGGSNVVRFLYGIDSLQDSLRVSEIDTAFRKALAKENTGIPFYLERKLLPTSSPTNFEDDEVVVGISRPISYRVHLGNSFPYLLRKMTSPIIFSVFLVGVTILSFVLLYRNLVRQHNLTALKNEFISNITHELKTPIATVSVAIEALKNFNALNDTRRTAEYLDISQNELQRLSLLVDKVLKLSMFEQKAIQLNKGWFDLCEVVRDVIESMKLQTDKAGAVIKFSSDNAECPIHADKLHITSVVYNLLDNALKYSPVNPEISIELNRYEEYIDLIIRDNGVGIPAEFKRKVFEKFFRVPNQDRHDIKGYGLGLSYVLHIAAIHQGFIEVESVVGQGSSFIIKLPIQELPVVHFDRNRKSMRKVIKLGFKKEEHES